MRMRYVFRILYCKTCPQKFRSSGIHAKRGFTEQVSGQPRVQRPTQTSGNMTILEAADLLHHQGHKGRNNENGIRERTGMLKLVVKQKRQELVADRLAIARSKTSLPWYSSCKTSSLILVLEHTVLLLQAGRHAGLSRRLKTHSSSW